MDIQRDAVEAAISSVSGKATYAGAGTTITGWLLSSEFAVLFGLVLGAAGFLMNSYYQWKRDRREQVEHELRLATLGAKQDKA